MTWSQGSRYFVYEVLRYENTSNKGQKMWFHELVTIPGFSTSHKVIKQKHVELLNDRTQWWFSQTVSFENHQAVHEDLKRGCFISASLFLDADQDELWIPASPEEHEMEQLLKLPKGGKIAYAAKFDSDQLETKFKEIVTTAFMSKFTILEKEKFVTQLGKRIWCFGKVMDHGHNCVSEMRASEGLTLQMLKTWVFNETGSIVEAFQLYEWSPKAKGRMCTEEDDMWVVASYVKCEQSGTTLQLAKRAEGRIFYFRGEELPFAFDAMKQKIDAIDMEMVLKSTTSRHIDVTTFSDALYELKDNGGNPVIWEMRIKVAGIGRFPFSISKKFQKEKSSGDNDNLKRKRGQKEAKTKYFVYGVFEDVDADDPMQTKISLDANEMKRILKKELDDPTFEKSLKKWLRRTKREQKVFLAELKMVTFSAHFDKDVLSQGLPLHFDMDGIGVYAQKIKQEEE